MADGTAELGSPADQALRRVDAITTLAERLLISRFHADRDLGKHTVDLAFTTATTFIDQQRALYDEAWKLERKAPQRG